MANDVPYELIYWPSLPGRGEFVRVLFEEAGVPYADIAKDAKMVMPLISGYTSGKRDDGVVPAFAVPILRHGDLVINQTPNILLYLAPRLGLAPSFDKGDDIFRLNAIVLTLFDGFVNEIHETHHPINTILYYEEQKDEAKRRADGFINGRVQKFLTYIQRVVESNKSGGSSPWLYGDSLTYADLVAFVGLDGTGYAFPKTMEKLRKSGEYDAAFKILDAVKERPNIKAYLASDRRQKFGLGIWRHYPELEE